MVETSAAPITGLSSADAPLSRRERRSADVQRRIFEAAMELFAKQGFTETTVEQITEAADIGKGTFFYHFPTKDHLLLSFAETRIRKIRAAREEAKKGVRAVKETLWSLFQSLAVEYLQTPQLFRCVVMAMLANETIRRTVDSRFNEGRRNLKEILALGQKRGEVRADRPAAEMALAFQCTFLGSFLLWSLCPEEKPAKWPQSAFEDFWSGVEARHAARVRKRKTA